ncbi:hypothetical protein [Noviherbaspirillum sp. Root189]|uniref:hypothetical protein n=1 Tax=Noviherbaspirillum sp. Root189 TaxID=1736487 RepID=UPI00070C376F|nr:hypothetical protein [Noviherbaspirillum sp. Root189]KRB93149.1 hypothetical protein ASE07_14005 [Noviherbaspirillum sp. Root189]
MKTLLLGISILTVAPTVLGETINFDSDTTGQPPTGWNCGTTGAGNPYWVVEKDATAPSQPNVLKQGGVAPFLWCVRGNSGSEDGSVEVKFKPRAGKEDQAGGLVWRWKDGKNYYVARANALESNVSLYYTVDGVRKTIKYVDAPVTSNVWHTLRVSYKGNSIQVLLNGKAYIDTRDSHISGPGKVGVWTKADSVTVFDDFTYNATDSK